MSVRRLSSGTSGLRNAVRADSDIEVEMKEIRAGIHQGQEHVRGTSREALLIDFSSSGSSGEEEGEDVSPAASDIGVLPLHGRGHPQPHFVPGYSYSVSGPPVQPIRVDARTVGRHVPLVDLGEQNTTTQDENSLDDAWRWFESDNSLASSSSISSSSSVTTTSYALKNISSETSKIETLVDVGSEAPIELVSVPQTIHVRHIAADGTHIKDSVHVIQAKPMALVDIDDNTSHSEPTLVDLGNDEVGEKRVPVLVPLSKSTSPELVHKSTAFEAEAGYSHPLETEAESVHVQVRPKSVILLSPLPTDPEASLLFGIEAEDLPHVADPEPEHAEELQSSEESIVEQVLVDVNVDAGHPSVNSGISTRPEQESPWSWDEVDVEDPWNQHISIGESTVSDPESDLITFPSGALSSTADDDALDGIVQDDHETEELGVLEMSPGGSLLPTAIEDELEHEGQDGIPLFDLESTEVEEEQSSQSLPIGEVEPEEEITPKPTPVSSAVELPEVVVMDVEENEFVYEPLVEKSMASPLKEDDVFVYPDPDLLPLPLHLEDTPKVDQPLATTTTLSVFAEALEAQMNTHLIAVGSASSQADNVVEKEHLIVPASQRLPSSQTPTPPASPPPMFGSHPPQSHTHLRVLNPTNASRNSSRTPSPVSPTPRLAVILPLLEREGQGEDKENDTPTAMTVGRFSEPLLATKPLWSIRASDAPALGIPSSGGVLGASPRMRRSVLGEVDSNAEEVTVAEEEKEESKEKPEEVVLPSETEVETKVDSEGEAEPAPTVVEPPTAEHQAAPAMKLSTSLPGSFPDVEPTSKVVESLPPAATSTSTIRRPVATPNGTAPTQFVIPSARTLVRSPLDIALAMQMRPGLGAGADPAWMVRFLMAVFGWMAVAVAGGDF